MENSFLKKIAATFLKKEQQAIKDCCFVFPNRRSCAFFQKYLIEESDLSAFMLPELATISDFVAALSGTIEANRVEQLFILYEEYSRLIGCIPFDQFLYWGDMLLSDFSDVDRYMADAKELFTNVENYKMINANYLTQEQIEVLNDYFGESRNFEDDSLWNDHEAKGKFFRLWSKLHTLYQNFEKRLAEKGLSFAGMTYRKAAESLKTKSRDSFGFNKVVFVGFSMLSTSEEQIFSYFRDAGMADFYWDFNSPVFSSSRNMFPIGRFDYGVRYPSRYDIQDTPILEMPNINIVSVPAGGGQAKIAGKIIGDLAEKGEIADLRNAIDTAIVLPEEKYLTSVLFSMPECIESLNVTMGYPMKHTPIASLFGILATLHAQKRKKDKESMYFHEDLDAFFAHPYISRMCKKGVRDLQREMVESRMFFVPASVIERHLPSLSFIFSSIEKDGVVHYAENIISFVQQNLIPLNPNSEKLESYFIKQYQNSLAQLKTIVSEHPAEIEEKTFFFLLDRMLSGTTVTFEGEPLQGLQVMGVLETRSLDFKNIIILSMNEKVFPAKHYTRSFIPNVIRTGYGIATYENQDAMSSYYFYRLISRAKNVFLLYDSRTQGISSGEESRFIYQIRKLYADGNLRSCFYEYAINMPDATTVSVKKTHQVMERLNAYRSAGSGKSFSPSAIISYLCCPLRFYLSVVERIQEEQEISDFVDSATLGDIVHRVLQNVYESIPNPPRKKDLESFLNSESGKYSRKLDPIITEAVNFLYNKLGEQNLQELTGESVLIGQIAKHYVSFVITHDLRFEQFEYAGSEVGTSFLWDLGEGIAINYTQRIDRIDRVDGTLRIVDYKTGNDDTEFKDIESLFDPGTTYKKKAIVQLFLYCNAYAASTNYADAITPVVYKIRETPRFLKSGFCIKQDGVPVVDYADYKEEFMEAIRLKIQEIFNPDIPFGQTGNMDVCRYCPFNELCGRNAGQAGK